MHLSKGQIIRAERNAHKKEDEFILTQWETDFNKIIVFISFKIDEMMTTRVLVITHKLGHNVSEKWKKITECSIIVLFLLFQQNKNLSRPVIWSGFPWAPPAVMCSRISSRVAWRVKSRNRIRVVLGELFQQSPDSVLVVSKNVIFFIWIFVQTKMRVYF